MNLVFVLADNMLAAGSLLPIEMWRAAEQTRLASRARGDKLEIATVSRDMEPVATQAGIGGVHFGDHRTGHTSRSLILGPEAVTPDFVGEMFEDREAVPHHIVPIPQDRNLAAGGLEFF